MAHMTHEFEDMPSQEWPNALRALKEATQHAWATIATLENLTDSAQWNTWSPVEDRGIYFELTGRAYTLLRDLRIEGMRQLAAWEHEQATSHEPQDQYFVCGRCKGDLVAHGVFVARDGVTVVGDSTPPCPYCGRSDRVQLQEKEGVDSPQN